MYEFKGKPNVLENGQNILEKTLLSFPSLHLLFNAIFGKHLHDKGKRGRRLTGFRL